MYRGLGTGRKLCLLTGIRDIAVHMVATILYLLLWPQELLSQSPKQSPCHVIVRPDPSSELQPPLHVRLTEPFGHALCRVCQEASTGNCECELQRVELGTVLNLEGLNFGCMSRGGWGGDAGCQSGACS